MVPMECLICTTTINNSRLGVNACRACAAFYKRAEGHQDQLSCKNNRNKCHEKNPKTTCRKCRFARFQAVIKRAATNSNPIDMNEGHERYEEIANEKDTPSGQSSFIDHTSFYECNPSTSVLPLLSTMRKGYSFMCIIRRCGELPMQLCRLGDKTVVTDNLVLHPTSHASIIPLWRVTKEAIIEFANYSFPDFQSLDLTSKDGLVERSLLFLDLLESTYRTCHYFPEDLELRMVGYTTFLRNSDLNRMLENSPEHVDKPNLIRALKQSMTQFSSIVRHHFDNTKPSDFEFIFLFGLAFWSEEFADHDDTVVEIARRYRSQILNELHEYYKLKGTVECDSCWQYFLSIDELHASFRESL